MSDRTDRCAIIKQAKKEWVGLEMATQKKKRADVKNRQHAQKRNNQPLFV